MKTLNNLDMDRIFAETETAVRERAQQLLQESRENHDDPQLAERRKADHAIACEQEAQRIVDSLPAKIGACIANGEQSLILLTVFNGPSFTYSPGAAHLIDKVVSEHNIAVANLVIEKLTGIDKLHVKRDPFQQSGRTGGFFVRVNW